MSRQTNNTQGCASSIAEARTLNSFATSAGLAISSLDCNYRGAFSFKDKSLFQRSRSRIFDWYRIDRRQHSADYSLECLDPK